MRQSRRQGALLPAAERKRIVRAHAQEFPDVWRSLVDDLGDEAGAKQVVFIGAVVAALGGVRAVDPSVLELIEENEIIARDPVVALAMALVATDLWSVAETTAVDEALAQIPDFLHDDAYEILWTAAIEAEAARLWSPRHEGRLARLVERLSAQLPIAGRANASAVLADGCAGFERDGEVRTRVAAILLATRSIRCNTRRFTRLSRRRARAAGRERAAVHSAVLGRRKASHAGRAVARTGRVLGRRAHPLRSGRHA